MALADASDLGKKGTYKYVEAACIDCGKERWVALKNGTPRSDRCYSCSNKLKPGRPMESNSNWKGGKHLANDGYVVCAVPPDSPFRCMVDSWGRVRKHRLVVAEQLGRPLETWEIVHHKNGNRSDNRIENLELLPDGTQHYSLTRMQQYIKSLEEEILELTDRLSKYEEVN